MSNIDWLNTGKRRGETWEVTVIDGQQWVQTPWEVEESKQST